MPKTRLEQTMKAALVKTLDGPSAIVVQTVDDPKPGEGEVIVDVAAAGLNFMDTLITRGKYQVKPALPFSPSAEMAGTVSAVGAGVSDFKVGDRVSAYLGYGAARQRVAVEARRLVRVPDAIPLELASALNVTYGTALYALRTRLSLKAGARVAVLGASGGAGLAAVEVAKCLGAEVIAVASSPEKLAVCSQHGATHLIDYTHGDLKQQLRDVTGGDGPDVIYDCVGGGHLEPALRSLKVGGDYVVIGFAAGDIPQIPANIVLLKDCNIVGIHWGAWVDADASPHADNVAVLFGWIADGALSPRAPEIRPLADIVAAVEDIAARRVVGKLAVAP
jgi:NADPH2:quinone reductase